MDTGHKTIDTSDAQPHAGRTMTFDSIESAIQDIKEGKLIIVVDDEDRENEGDFICAAELITPEKINFMASYGRGLICTPITEQRASDLELNKMVSNNTALHETAFTVSIDYLHDGCTTGISAYDRATGIGYLTKETTQASDFARPGHIFPLIAKDGGVLRRTGHTEAAVDLARMAGLYPAGVLVEILNEDGSMARLPDLQELAKTLDLKLICIKDLVKYRLENESQVSQVSRHPITLQGIDFEAIVYTDKFSNSQHLALVKGDLTSVQQPAVRVQAVAQSLGVYSVLFDNLSERISKAMAVISEQEAGVLLILQTGAETGDLISKISGNKSIPHNLEDQIQKDYGIGAQILRNLGLKQIQLISSVARKQVALEGYGLEIVDHLPFS